MIHGRRGRPFVRIMDLSCFTGHERMAVPRSHTRIGVASVPSCTGGENKRRFVINERKGKT